MAEQIENEAKAFFIGVTFGLIVGFLFTAWLSYLTYCGLQRQAVARGFAEYAPDGKEWKWKEQANTTESR